MAIKKLLSRLFQWLSSVGMALGVLLLVACGGGGPAGLSGSGDAASFTAGGPVGGNAADGTVSLPAPGSHSTEGVETGAYVACKNLGASTVKCWGSGPSAKTGSSVRLTVYPASYAQQKPLSEYFLGCAYAAGFSTAVVAQLTGWQATLVAASGEKVEILLTNPFSGKINRVVLPVPLKGQQIDWNFNNGMKNLQVDSEGNQFFSLRWLGSLLIGEAYADEGGSRYTGFVGTGILGPVFTATVARPQCADELDPLTVDRYPDNQFRIKWIPRGETAVREILLRGCLQDCVHGIVPFKDSATGASNLAVAVDKAVYLISMTPTPRLVRKIYYSHVVEKILDLGNDLYVLQQRPEVESTPGIYMIETGKQFYKISKNSAAGFPSECIPSLEAGGLKRFLSSDSYGNGFAWVGLFETGEYRVLAGRSEGDGAAAVAPFKILDSANPVTVNVLDLRDGKISLAILDSAQKKLRLMEWDLAAPTAPTKDIDVDLTSLHVGTAAIEIQNPALSAVDHLHQSYAFLDFHEDASFLVIVPFVDAGGLLTSPLRAERVELGEVAPSQLIYMSTREQQGWAYNVDQADGSSTVQVVRPLRTTLNFTPRTFEEVTGGGGLGFTLEGTDSSD